MFESPLVDTSNTDDPYTMEENKQVKERWYHRLLKTVIHRDQGRNRKIATSISHKDWAKAKALWSEITGESESNMNQSSFLRELVHQFIDEKRDPEA